MNIIGISSTSMFDVKSFISTYKQELDEIKKGKLKLQYVGFGDTPKEDTFLALVPCVGVLKSVYEYFNPKTRIIVFDSPILLHNIGITVIDAITKDNIRYSINHLTYETFKNHLVDLLKGSHNIDADFEFKLIPHLLQTVKGSLTQRLLNLTMKSRVPERRRQITMTYIVWLLAGGETQELHDKLIKAGVDEGALKGLIEWFDSEEGLQARNIFREIRRRQLEGKSINYDSLCKKTSIKPFDIKYLLSHVRSLGTLNRLDSTSVEEYNKRQQAKAKAKEIVSEGVVEYEDGTVDFMGATLEELMAYEREQENEE